MRRIYRIREDAVNKLDLVFIYFFKKAFQLLKKWNIFLVLINVGEKQRETETSSHQAGDLGLYYFF